MLVLGFDCTAPRLTLGLAKGDRPIGRWEDTPQRHRGDALDGLIDRALTESGLDRSEIEGLALVAGPGSLTAMRIGWATACGWAKATGIPVTGWSAPEVQWRAWLERGSRLTQANEPFHVDADVYCMVHHRGFEYYCYQLLSDKPPGRPVAVVLGEWRPAITRPAILIGPGLLTHPDQWAHLHGQNTTVFQADEALVGGDTLAQWGVENLIQGRRFDLSKSPLDYGLPPTFRKAS